MSYTFAANAADTTKVSFWLIEIVFPGGVTWRGTNADVDILTLAGTYPGDGAPGAQTFLCGRYFSVNNISAGVAVTAGSENITADNADNYFSAIQFAGPDPAGSVVRVWEALFDPENLASASPADVKLRLLRRVAAIKMSASPTVREVTIDLEPYVPLLSLVMARRHLEPRCQFRYLDPTSCQATGPDATCDHSLTACSMTTKTAGGAVGGNRLNFGGFVTVTAKTQ